MVASRSKSVTDVVHSRLAGHGRYAVTANVMNNGHADPLHDVAKRPEILLLHHTPGTGELEFLAEQLGNRRVPLIVFGPAGDPNAMRLAMRAGAADYLLEPLSEADLLATLDRVSADVEKTGDTIGKLITVVNSKGGSGASFIATNLACSIARNPDTRLTLMDLDLQFGGLARYLDLNPERGLLEALGEIEDMDATSLEAYVKRHKSGVKLLAAPSDHLALSKDIPSERIDALMQLFLANNDYVVTDVPRRIDDFTATVMERSDQIVLVVQQSLAHVNDAARMIQLMTDELSIGRDRVLPIVNRFEKNEIIELDDIRKALKIDGIVAVPNHYKVVVESINSGVPLFETAKNSIVGKAIKEVEQKVCGTTDDAVHGKSFLRRALPGLLGGS